MARMNDGEKEKIYSFIVMIVSTALMIVFLAFVLMKGSEGANEIQEAPKEETQSSVQLENGTRVEIIDSTLEMSMGADRLVVQICTPSIVRVNFLPEGKKGPATEVVSDQQWQPVAASIDVNEDPMVITTDEMIVKISQQDHRISIYDRENQFLIGEKEAGSVTQDGVKFTYDAKDFFYGVHGFSANALAKEGMLRQKGGTIRAGSQGDSGAPLIWSTKGYGLLVNSEAGLLGKFDDQLSFSRGTKEDMEYFIMVGEPKQILSSVAQISGKPPMFPKWAMGFHNTEWGIDEKELIESIDTYRSKQLPIDNYVLDFDWKAWGEDQYGEFRWNEEKFPNGASGKLKETMDQKGLKLTGIMKPRLHVDTEQGRFVTENNFWWPTKKPYSDYFSKKQVNDLNFAIPEVRTWFFEHSKAAFDTGIIGWWNDEADEGYDNVQFLNMQKALYEGQRKHSTLRVWSINRNFYLGAQRYAYGIWSGDIATGFRTMAAQRERMLSNINLGQMKWGMDTGGFHGKPSPENYARWLQFSAFTPIFRVHGTENQQRQPWMFGEEAEAAVKPIMHLRYQLIPYIYAYERKAYETGIGLVTPLFYEDPTDEKLANYVDAWMFGEYLLVAPVVEEKQEVKEIYLPKGTWIDYFKGIVYEGAQTIQYPVDAETWSDVPLFIKKGGIIPTQEYMNYVGEKPVTTLYMNLFPDVQETTFKYYDDDGSTYNYEKGEYFIQEFSLKEDQGTVKVKISDKQGKYTPELAHYLLKIHGKKAQDLKVSGNNLEKTETMEDLMSLEEGWTQGTDVYGDVVYVKLKAGSQKNVEMLP